MEYGPRALGNRSILASPRDRSLNDTLNQRLKRTEFMRFAPVVLAERAYELFCMNDNIAYAATFMTIVVDVQQEWREQLGAVVRVDGTARPQLIARDQNPTYYDIVKAYEATTGIPALVNTSFNVHEEPIVESPDDALRSLELGAIDYLVAPPYLLEFAPRALSRT